MQKLARLMYFSRPTGAGPRSLVLDQITAHAARRNAERDITGVLIATADAYAQLLEGPRGALSDLVFKIGADDRHTDMTIVDFRPTLGRVAPSWAMTQVHLQPPHKEPAPDFATLRAFSSDQFVRFFAANMQELVA